MGVIFLNLVPRHGGMYLSKRIVRLARSDWTSRVSIQLLTYLQCTAPSTDSMAKCRVESSLDICSWRRTRCTVTTAPDDGTRHPQLQPALSSAGTDEWVFSWRLNDESVSSGDRMAVGSRFQVVGPYTAKLRWPVDVRVQGTRRAPETAERDWRRPSVDAAGTEVDLVMSCRHFHTGTAVLHQLTGDENNSKRPSRRKSDILIQFLQCCLSGI